MVRRRSEGKQGRKAENKTRKGNKEEQDRAAAWGIQRKKIKENKAKQQGIQRERRLNGEQDRAAAWVNQKKKNKGNKETEQQHGI